MTNSYRDKESAQTNLTTNYGGSLVSRKRNKDDEIKRWKQFQEVIKMDQKKQIWSKRMRYKKVGGVIGCETLLVARPLDYCYLFRIV